MYVYVCKVNPGCTASILQNVAKMLSFYFIVLFKLYQTPFCMDYKVEHHSISGTIATLVGNDSRLHLKYSQTHSAPVCLAITVLTYPQYTRTNKNKLYAFKNNDISTANFGYHRVFFTICLL